MSCRHCRACPRALNAVGAAPRRLQRAAACAAAALLLRTHAELAGRPWLSQAEPRQGPPARRRCGVPSFAAEESIGAPTWSACSPTCPAAPATVSLQFDLEMCSGWGGKRALPSSQLQHDSQRWQLQHISPPISPPIPQLCLRGAPSSSTSSCRPGRLCWQVGGARQRVQPEQRRQLRVRREPLAGERFSVCMCH